MATIILTIIIFGSASTVIYKQLKTGKSCDACSTHCDVKHERKKTK